jgi:DNA-binding protein HU-beta
MNKAQLIECVVKETGVSKKDAEAVLKSIVDNTIKAVKKGEGVQLVGFGTFAQAKRKARTAKNPKTGEEIKIAAKKVPVFKAGKAFKETVNGTKAKK